MAMTATIMLAQSGSCDPDCPHESTPRFRDELACATREDQCPPHPKRAKVTPKRFLDADSHTAGSGPIHASLSLNPSPELLGESGTAPAQSNQTTAESGAVHFEQCTLHKCDHCSMTFTMKKNRNTHQNTCAKNPAREVLGHLAHPTTSSYFQIGQMTLEKVLVC